MHIKTTILLLGVIAIPLISACGIKPGFVDAPAHVEQDSFPHTYPHPATDPAP